MASVDTIELCTRATYSSSHILPQICTSSAESHIYIRLSRCSTDLRLYMDGNSSTSLSVHARQIQVGGSNISKGMSLKAIIEGNTEVMSF